MGEVLEKRRQETTKRLQTIRSSLTETEARASGKACVYATGSFARGEASDTSDLDLFIVGPEVDAKPALSKLDEICIKADLIYLTKDLNIPEFSGDGEYLAHYTTKQLTRTLGRADDDARNTFTARLLLLLESAPLVGDAIYEEAISEVISSYWRDFLDHKMDFVPAFLANDILRIWRTFCVNYEARTDSENETKKAKRKLKNYKLKHSRLLTCFSGLAYLLGIYRLQRTVTPENARDMVHLTPTRQLEWLLRHDQLGKSCGVVEELINQYERFLESTQKPEAELLQAFLDKTEGLKLRKTASEFGNRMFSLLEAMGTEGTGKNDFYRMLLV